MLKKKHAIIYTRVSSQEQVENHSLASQKRACEEFCEREGLEVERVFSDEGESAKTADRPQLQQALEHCRQHRDRIACFVVRDVTRFARQLHDHTGIHLALKQLGIRLVAVMEPFDDTPSGKLVENLLASIAQFDNDQKAARTIEGMKASLAAGRWTHQPPLGYLEPAGGKAEPSLVHDPERAPLLRVAFERMATGACTKQQVLDELTAAGLRTRRGEPLSAQSLTNLLRNPLYAGLLRVPKWNFEGPGDFEPIVSREVFECVQDVLHGRRPTVVSRHRDHPDFPLRRFVCCDACGAPLTGSWSRGRNDRYPHYFCHSRACGEVSVRKERLEAKFRLALADLAVRPEVLALFEEIVRDVWKARHAECIDRRRRLGTRLDPRQKVMFQQAVHPEGFPYAAGRFGTARTSWAFGYLREQMNSETRMASPDEPDWNQLDAWFTAVQTLREAVQPAL